MQNVVNFNRGRNIVVSSKKKMPPMHFWSYEKYLDRLIWKYEIKLNNEIKKFLGEENNIKISKKEK
jgi:hypothetical protein